MNDRRRSATNRTYRPEVEGLEALTLLANAGPLAADVFATREAPTLHETEFASFPDSAWDEALSDSRVAELIGVAHAPVRAEDLRSGINQLNRYLAKAWYRTGLDPQKHDDCTQAVFASMLQNLGRTRFDGLLGEVGREGVREVLHRDSDQGPDFFRIVDAVKKRAQRERVHQPIDAYDVAESRSMSNADLDRRGALREAISQALNPREAALIQATLQGQTPAEIAQSWGVAPKTVSNEKARALQKLREVLVASPND